MPVHELASVDGAIAPTAETSIPLKDDGLYRGDGVFEVIRLYGGRPFALASTSTASSARRRRSRCPPSVPSSSPRSRRCSRQHGEADAQLRLIVTRGGRRIALIEPLVEHTETVVAGHRHLRADRDPQRGQVALLRRQHAGDADRQGRRRRRGAARAPGRDRARGADLDDLLGHGRRAADPGAATSGILDSITRSAVVEALARGRGRVPASTTCSGAARPSSPRPSARSSRSRRSTRRRSSPGRAPPRRAMALRSRGRRRARRGSGRMIELTRRAAADRRRRRATSSTTRSIPRARDSDRAQKFDLELARRLGEMGYLGAPVAEEYGGRGLDFFVLRADRRGGRPRRLGDAHRGLGPDLARLRLDRALGHRRSRSSAGCRR